MLEKDGNLCSAGNPAAQRGEGMPPPDLKQEISQHRTRLKVLLKCMLQLGVFCCIVGKIIL